MIKYNYNAPIEIGSVVCASIGDFEGNKKIAMFLVLYDEKQDSSVVGNDDVIALKITSKDIYKSKYLYNITKNRYDFLDKNCLVCCNNLHTLNKITNVYKIIGKLDKEDLYNVCNLYNQFNNELLRQLMSS